MSVLVPCFFFRTVIIAMKITLDHFWPRNQTTQMAIVRSAGEGCQRKSLSDKGLRFPYSTILFM